MTLRFSKLSFFPFFLPLEIKAKVIPRLTLIERRIVESCLVETCLQESQFLRAQGFQGKLTLLV